MIIADSFCQNAKARASEFSTTVDDSPLVVQFAANNVADFVDASTLVYPYSDGVDLNCGCPQRWAMKDGYGCALLLKPELIHDLVKGVKRNLSSDFSVSVKIRILSELKNTINLCHQLENCGINFITVHGRTPLQKSGDGIDVDALQQVCESVRIPVIANGGIKSLEDADHLYNTLKCDGIMAASGLLSNPALFSGAKSTPLDCIRLWMDIKNQNVDKITFQCYHHHLVFMLDKILSKQQKQEFNYLSTFESVDEFLLEYILNNYNSVPQPKYNLSEFVACEFADEITLKHSSKCRGCSKSLYYCICSKYDCNDIDGNFFKSYVKQYDELDYMCSNIFDETNL
ncbi:tRNA-dihydrouridine(20a/20b) synthase [NAD(P)+]-like isoform X2 [Epargyreus clarus]